MRLLLNLILLPFALPAMLVVALVGAMIWRRP